MTVKAKDEIETVARILHGGEFDWPEVADDVERLPWLGLGQRHDWESGDCAQECREKLFGVAKSILPALHKVILVEATKRLIEAVGQERAMKILAGEGGRDGNESGNE